MDDSESLRVVEALLFVSDEPLTAQRISEVLECEKREATRLVESLADKFNSNGRAVSIEQIAGGWQLRTKTELAPWIRKYLATRPVRLSRAALEVLAVVAYRQPITRNEIESIRGVDCSAVLQSLLERKLVKIMGRKDVPGRPIIYGTTRQFLEHFNLPDLSQLPTLREFAEPTGGHARPDGSEGEEGGDDDSDDESFARTTAGAEGDDEASIEAEEETGDEARGDAQEAAGDESDEGEGSDKEEHDEEGLDNEGYDVDEEEVSDDEFDDDEEDDQEADDE
ncbi:MAG: SMC-Scp complex subunit ScpB [Deltaproteobacteria bacterium]|nr:SMC-Scp complex subunit ScpB [Deltaproteobacteria bacterium]